MSKIFILALAVASSAAFAGILGVLVKSEATTSVTGKLVYRCTYNVAGRNVTVILDRLCPPTMQFE
jgi:hypothetical protein